VPGDRDERRDPSRKAGEEPERRNPGQDRPGENEHDVGERETTAHQPSLVVGRIATPGPRLLS
jgi:hypothetical protein